MPSPPDSQRRQPRSTGRPAGPVRHLRILRARRARSAGRRHRARPDHRSVVQRQTPRFRPARSSSRIAGRASPTEMVISIGTDAEGCRPRSGGLVQSGMIIHGFAVLSGSVKEPTRASARRRQIRIQVERGSPRAERSMPDPRPRPGPRITPTGKRALVDARRSVAATAPTGGDRTATVSAMQVRAAISRSSLNDRDASVSRAISGRTPRSISWNSGPIALIQ